MGAARPLISLGQRRVGRFGNFWAKSSFASVDVRPKVSLPVCLTLSKVAACVMMSDRRADLTQDKSQWRNRAS
jgi:hypothetical protein